MEKIIRFPRHENRAIRTAGIINKYFSQALLPFKLKAPVETGA